MNFNSLLDEMRCLAYRPERRCFGSCLGDLKDSHAIVNSKEQLNKEIYGTR